MADALSELSRSSHGPTDPEAQAAVNDFLDYTEFFPSDLLRSLTLIGNLDEAYTQDTATIHDLTKTYSLLPTLDPRDRPDAKQLRRSISHALDSALRSRESAFAEASRICNVADALHLRLKGIRKKLQELPKPPSRDATPAPQPRSPTASRTRNQDGVPRLTLVFDGNRPGSRGNAAQNQANAARPRHHSRRFIVPGEILPPYDPTSTGGSVTSDSESEPPSPPKPSRDRLKMPKIKLSKLHKLHKMRPHGLLGTNVHSTVAGISVSNALAQLPQPPPNPQPGSSHAPWLKLTEWELNKLRKRMKKNANWVPSDTMVRRELLDNGRGRENMVKAKKRAEETGEAFLNEEPPMFSRALLMPADLSMEGDGEEQIENRGMRLNQAKKLKQAKLESAAALSSPYSNQSTLDEATRQIMNAALKVRGLLSPNTSAMTEQLYWELPTTRESAKKNKKRKREQRSLPAADDTPSPAAAAVARPQPKKIKLSSSATPISASGTTTVQVPLAPPAPSPEPAADARGKKSRSSTSASTNLSTPAPATPVEAAAAAVTARSKARGSNGLSLTLTHKKAASAEPPGRRISLRRASNASLPAGQQDKKASGTPATATAASSRGKRPAPGLLKSTAADGGAKVSLGKRKAAPDRKTGAPAAAAGRKSARASADAEEEAAAQDAVDADEERYCVCNDVSWGEMVACENDDCPVEWFHLPCVGLKQAPGPRTKWWCPDCKEALFGAGPAAAGTGAGGGAASAGAGVGPGASADRKRTLRG